MSYRGNYGNNKARRLALTRLLKLAAMALVALQLSSCSPLNLSAGGTDDLLRAPILNQKQADLGEALSATLNLSEIVYRYPQNGENKTPFIFYDLDGDSRDEAIVFYSFSSRTAEIRAKLLRQDPEGEWYSYSDKPGQGDQIDFVDFVSLASPDVPCVLIGWQDTSRRENTLEIYTLDENGFGRETSHKYSAYSVVDYGGNGLSRIILVAKENRSSPFELRMLGGQSGHVRLISSCPLYGEVTSILQMEKGRLWDGTIAIWVDELLDNDTVATEIVRVYTNTLLVAAGAANGEESPEWSDYLSTFRPDRLLSADIDNDDQVEVPHAISMPGVEEADEISPLMLTVYRKLTPEGFKTACTVAVNSADGYLVFYPDRWLETVQIIIYPEAGQWRFFKTDEKTLLPSAELLRVTTLSYNDYDSLGTDGGILLGTRGATRYYGYIPPAADEPLAITPGELSVLFRLI